VLSDEERQFLERLARRRKSAQAMAEHKVANGTLRNVDDPSMSEGEPALQTSTKGYKK
jgi:hypothetical protein